MAGGRYSAIPLGSSSEDFDAIPWRAIIFDHTSQRLTPMGGTHWIWSSETTVVRGSSLYEWPLFQMEERGYFVVTSSGYNDEWEWVEEGEWIPVVIWEDVLALQDPTEGEGTLRVGAITEEDPWD